MKNKIKQLVKLNYHQILLVFFAFLTMVLVSYFYVSDMVRKQMVILGEETMNTTQTAVSASISEAELIFANLVQGLENLLAESGTNEEIQEYLIETNQHYSAEGSSLQGFMDIYAYINSEFMGGSGWIPPAEYEPTARPWYIGAVESENQIFFSEPYLDAETGEICISFSTQIYDRAGTNYGVLAIDLKLSGITDYVKEQQIANNGYGVLVSDTLQFMAHKDNSLLGTNMQAAGKGYVYLAGLLETNENISAERFVDIDGTDSVAFFRTIFNGWHIGVFIPRANYYANVYQMGAVLSLLGIALMGVLSGLLIRTTALKIRSDEENVSKSAFLARMSHEMRTPMNAIIGMTDIAHKTGDMQRIQYCLSRINDAATHLLGIINDVLDISKIEADKLELSETDFVVKEMINRVIAVTGFKIEEKQQKLLVNVDDQVPNAIVADMQRLTQVITNLLSNANKFTPECGTISVSVTLLERRERVCILQIEVADDGIGIAKPQQALLFRSFEQGDGSISRKYGGTGLGLAISKNIVEMMKGRIWIESEPGQGAKFIFTIRAKVGEAREQIDIKLSKPKEEYAEAGPLFLGKCVLLAEDIEINREILISLLGETGVKIESAENGKAAVEMFSASPGVFDLIFMDIHMPEMDGYEATRNIRSLPIEHAKSIPIIAMTANVFKEDVEQCLSAGMNDHVGKPINIKEVIEKMKKFLN